MRRRPTILLASCALAVTGCQDATDPEAPTSTSGTEAPAPSTAAPDEADGTTSAPADDAAATTGPGEESGGADGGADGEVEGGEEGQAAADRAKEFLLLIVDADPAACGLILSPTDTTRPMREVESDLELCETTLPETMASTVQAQGLTDEERAVLEAMQITGAEVDGDTAVVDRDNFSDLFADSMGEAPITLVQIDGEWFVDLDRSFQES